MADDPEFKVAPGEGLKIIGVLMAVLGIIIVIISWFLATSVSTQPSYAEILNGASAAPTEVANLGLMQRQIVVLISGGLVWLVGTILYAAGALLANLSPREPILPARAPPMEDGPA